MMRVLCIVVSPWGLIGGNMISMVSNRCQFANRWTVCPRISFTSMVAICWVALSLLLQQIADIGKMASRNNLVIIVRALTDILF